MASRPADSPHAATAAFAQLTPDARGHFVLHFYAAIHRVLCYVRRVEQLTDGEHENGFARYAFLAGYQAEIARVLPEQAQNDPWHWWEQEIAAWEMGVSVHLPLRALDNLGITFQGRIALLLAGLADIDSRLGTLLAQLQAPLAQRRPTIETVGQMLADDWINGVDAWEICRPLLHCGLLEVVNPDVPRAEWMLRIPALLWELLRGIPAPRPAPWCRLYAPGAFELIDALILPDELRRRLAQVPALVREGRTNCLVLRGMQGSERREVLGAVARALGLGLAEIDLVPGRTDGDGADDPRWHGAGPLCVMARCLPVISYDLGPGETVEPQIPAGFTGPVGILLGQEGGLRGPLAERSLTIHIPFPDAALRLRHWHAALPGEQTEHLETIVERFHLPGGTIRQVAAMAEGQAALDGRSRVTLDDVRAAGRSLNRQQLDTLAARVEGEGNWEQLVVNATTGLKLRELERRCRHRERLLGHLGAAFGGANRGVRALLSGGSGTGKTLAARILAAELGMDIYRVDLGAVVNKYIGETEKNLHRVLARAEELDVVLLLDEGDSLLGSRTEIKSANDRYANLETNYLLQRLESYQGIVLITTNASQSIDRAFQRRIDVIVPFVPPQSDERRLIWALHLPADNAVPADYLEEVATRCALSGGQIRNAALLATLLALDDNDGSVQQRHLEQAIDAEYRKAGGLSPLRTLVQTAEHAGGISAFIGTLTVSG